MRSARSTLTGALLGFVPLAILLSGCHSTARHRCRPTVTSVAETSSIDARNVWDSGVVRARLTSGAAPVAGERLTMALVIDGDVVALGAHRTGRDGDVRIDLKPRFLDEPRLAFADRVHAVFHGTPNLCRSRGSAEYHEAHVPVAGPIDSPVTPPPLRDPLRDVPRLPAPDDAAPKPAPCIELAVAAALCLPAAA